MLLTSIAFSITYSDIPNIDYPFNEVDGGYEPSIDLLACQDKCTANLKCIAIVTVPFIGNDYLQKNECWLKEKLELGVTRQDRIVYYKEDFPATLHVGETIDGMDILEHTIEFKDLAFQKCRQHCVQLSGCGGFVLDLAAGKGCWFKDSTIRSVVPVANAMRQLSYIALITKDAGEDVGANTPDSHAGPISA